MQLNDAVNATATNYLHEVLGVSTHNSTEVINKDGHMSIDAQNGDDKVVVTQNGLMLQVRVNGNVVVDANVCKTKTLTIQGGFGNDNIRVDSSVTFPLTLIGGPGADVIDARNAGNNTVHTDPQDTLFVKGSDRTYTDLWQDVVGGKSTGGTICIPMSHTAYFPPPLTMPTTTPMSPPETIDQTDKGFSPEQIQQMWNDTLYESTNQNVLNTSKDLMRKEEEKSKKLEKILVAALHSGNLDTAVLLISGLETSRANSITAGLLGRIENLQSQRKNLASQMSGLGNTAQDAQKASGLNLEASNMATEISLLQTFLQEVSSQKQEAQQLASNFIKNRHETAMSILRNG